ncbi:MAG TPA: hypothetical protein VIF83_11090 [Gemmatimonadaceae bacterium]|jgi:photosystem II stability/assembly factor-like uncharacterized protein
MKPIGSRARAVTLIVACAAGLSPRALSAQTIPRSLYSALEWRMIGPFRGGRTVGATGVRGQPNVFYIGVNNGGVWKTTDYGHTWTPIFDDQPTGSIGDIAVAPSNPNIVYVATGEGLQRPDLAAGDGIYKSTDAGRTWTHLGLREAQQIASIAVDPKNPDRVFVAALGHPYGPNSERGIYRSTDGGQHWERVLYRDENTGAMQVAFDPTDSRIVYADLWAGRQAPWEIGSSFNGPGSGLFKSTDGGTTWRQLTSGLPTIAQGLGRIGFAIAPTDPRRLYATVDGPAAIGGIYRSDDGGESWRRMNPESRLWGRGSDFAELKVHPRNADVLFVANVASYRSDDGGKTFTAIKGAPGGDDYHRIWINPDNPDIMLFAADQGATLTVNGGATWSSWYNQPTAQFYHVITDNRVPYWVYGGQQESGSAGVISRGDNGAITFRDWRTVGVEEYGYVAPDPLDPNLIYGGKISRFDHRTGEVQNVSPEPVRSGKYRFVRTMPVIFSPVDPKSLYLGSNVLFKTTTGGKSWEIISPDLTRESYEVPKNLGIFTALDPEKGKHRGVIYTVAPSFRDAQIIWAGTDDGLIHFTRDGGKSWKNVTPPDLSPWSKVSLMTASHFDDETAYAAVNRFRLDDLRPHIYRTHDGGTTWKEITDGIPDNEVVNAVREDPVRKGMLYAGSERAVYVSWDDGESWQSLRMNMPATSIRDLVIHDDDIVVGTHGRSFWILDDVSPLRQMNSRTARSGAVLFKPRVTYRFRRNKNTDTPLPPEEPAGKNPPDGAIIYYYLRDRSNSPVTISIHDASGKLIRRFSSADKPDSIPADLNIPLYWIRAFQSVSTAAGMHRFVWDLHHAPPSVSGFNYPISAIIHDTPREPLGPAVAPGEYRVSLSVGGQTYTQPLTVRMDPRSPMTPAELAEQERIGLAMLEATRATWPALTEVRRLRKTIGEMRAKGGPSAPPTIVEALASLEPRLAGIETGAAPVVGLARLNAEAAALLGDIEGADMPLTTQMVAKSSEITQNVASILGNWKTIQASIERMNPSVQRALGRTRK